MSTLRKDEVRPLDVASCANYTLVAPPFPYSRSPDPILTVESKPPFLALMLSSASPLSPFPQ